jgi:hypothetical protein
MIQYMLITNNPSVATYAESCGVSRIFVDLECIGKNERQGHLDTLISRHSMADVPIIRDAIKSAELLVRLNPLYDGTNKETEEAIAGGADLLMLPMFKDHEELQTFSEIVDGRVPIIPLVETVSAVQDIEKIVRVQGIKEVYIGLNDLHLDMGLRFMFEPLANGLVDELAVVIKSSGLPFGFGGVARVGEGAIPGEMILGEHVRLGSNSVILSRTFHRKSDGIEEFQTNLDLQTELRKLNESWLTLHNRTEAEAEVDFLRLQETVSEYLATNV